MTQIAPKPTVYKGITYRSRLEAAWAVFYENLENWDTDYEPNNISRLYGINYTPDFGVSKECYRYPNYVVYHEVKPSFPNVEYCRLLRRIAEAAAHHNSRLILTTESFFENVPKVSVYPFVKSHPQVPLAGIFGKRCGITRAVKAAQYHRWDL